MITTVQPETQGGAQQMTQGDTPIAIPPGYPASLIFIDESGAAANDRIFVIGALKVRRPGELMRAVRHARDQTDFTDEYRFNRSSLGKLPAYYAAIDQLDRPTIHFAACVLDRQTYDPFSGKRAKWDVQASLTAQLLRGCINKREITSICIDHVSTPPGVSYEEAVRDRVNRRFGNLSIATAACHDSRSTDGLQLVDLLTGAVAWEYRHKLGVSGTTNSHKAKVVNRVKQVLGVADLAGRTSRVNIVVLSPPTPRQPLRAITGGRAS